MASQFQHLAVVARAGFGLVGVVEEVDVVATLESSEDCFFGPPFFLREPEIDEVELAAEVLSTATDSLCFPCFCELREVRYARSGNSDFSGVDGARYL